MWVLQGYQQGNFLPGLSCHRSPIRYCRCMKSLNLLLLCATCSPLVLAHNPVLGDLIETSASASLLKSSVVEATALLSRSRQAAVRCFTLLPASRSCSGIPNTSDNQRGTFEKALSYRLSLNTQEQKGIYRCILFKLL